MKNNFKEASIVFGFGMTLMLIICLLIAILLFPMIIGCIINNYNWFYGLFLSVPLGLFIIILIVTIIKNKI